MPLNACLYFYVCKGWQALLKPKAASAACFVPTPTAPVLTADRASTASFLLRLSGGFVNGFQVRRREFRRRHRFELGFQPVPLVAVREALRPELVHSAIATSTVSMALHLLALELWRRLRTAWRVGRSASKRSRGSRQTPY